jgi:hypothetical protein
MAVGGAALLVPACAHNDSSLFIQGVLAPPQSAATSGCVFTTDPTQAIESSGTLDVGVTDAYYAEYLVANQIIPQSNQDQLQTETSTINIQGAVVKIIDERTNDLLANFTSYGATTVYPANGSTPGYAPVGVMIVDPTTSAALLAGFAASGHAFGHRNILTSVFVFGKTLGGDYIESNTFEFQITACDGCLVRYTTVTPTISCSGPAPTTSGAPFCALGQDVAFDCHDCLGNPICDCGQNTACP